MVMRPERLTTAELNLYNRGQDEGILITNFTVDYSHFTPVVRYVRLTDDSMVTRELTVTPDQYDPFVMGLEDAMCDTEVLGAIA